MSVLIFANSSGQTLITRTNLATRTSFSFPELDQAFNALVTSTQVQPRPIINNQATLGGTNYLNVFGEDPMMIEIEGMIAGSACGQAVNASGSALANGVSFYSQYGVVNNVTPVRYRIQGQKQLRAFLASMVIMQENSFVDLAKFKMTLLSESLDQRQFSSPTSLLGSSGSNNQAASNTGLSQSITNSALMAGSTLGGSLVASTGELLGPPTLQIIV